MAELQLTLRYNSTPARVALTLMMVLLPIWGVLAPILTTILLYALFTVASTGSSLMEQMRWVLALLIVSISGVLTSLALADNRLLANQSGIYLPFFLAGLNRKIAWSNISRITFHQGAEKGTGTLKLFTKRKKSFSIDVSRLIQSELDQLLLATDVWGSQCEKSPELLEFHRSLQTHKGSEEQTYTAMWEQELERRFASTAFIPLDPETTLLNGKLKVVRQLSFGGFSAIYLCLREDKTLVVLKEAVIPANSKRTLAEKACELFEREAKLLERLDHPGIVKVLDHFGDKGRQYILFEYLNGQDLRQFVKQHGRQHEVVVRQWAMQLASVLSYLHTQNPAIIHRDFTPDNIVISEDESLRVIDFGAANELLGQATGTLVGKQAYISPEQFRGKANAQSDLYAFGCTLFFLLTGEDPEPLATSRPKSHNNAISSEMDQLVADLTAMELDERIQDTQELQTRLNGLVPTAGKAC